MLQCVALYCSVLQCVAISERELGQLKRLLQVSCCIMLQCVAVCCVAVCCSMLQCLHQSLSANLMRSRWLPQVSYCSVLCCRELHYVAVCCIMLQYLSANSISSRWLLQHCNMMQHTATRQIAIWYLRQCERTWSTHVGVLSDGFYFHTHTHTHTHVHTRTHTHKHTHILSLSL